MTDLIPIEVRTCSLRYADRILTASGGCCNGYDLLVSISGANGTSHNTIKAPHTLLLKFDDVPEGGMVPATANDMAKLANYGRHLSGGQKVLIH